MNPTEFSDAEHASKCKRPRREVFLAEMEQGVPWPALVSLIEPHYPVADAACTARAWPDPEIFLDVATALASADAVLPSLSRLQLEDYVTG